MTATLYTRTKICIFLFLTVLLKRCDSGVVVSLRLDRFINPGGSCCNVRHGQCEPCYYEFQVCAARPSGYPYTSTGDLFCEYGRWNTGIIQPHEDSREDVSYLPSRFPSGHTNPLEIKVPYWEGRVQVTINVRDVGMWGYGNDPVIEYIFSLFEWRLGRTEQESFTLNWLLVRYGLRLDLQYAVYCQPDFYGHFCRRHCQPPTFYDQYTCDTNTGRQICHRGYTGYNCKQRVLPTSSTTNTSNANSTADTITSSVYTPSSTSHTSTSTTDTVTSTTDTPTSTIHTTPTTDTTISTALTPSSTTHTPTSTADTLTSTADTSTTYTPTSSMKGTTHDAKLTIIVTSTAQTSPPQTITTTSKEQATTAIRISDTTPATTQSPKPTPTDLASSTFEPSTLIGKYVTTEVYSTSASADENLTTERILTFGVTDSNPTQNAIFIGNINDIFDMISLGQICHDRYCLL